MITELWDRIWLAFRILRGGAATHRVDAPGNVELEPERDLHVIVCAFTPTELVCRILIRSKKQE